MIKYTSHTAYDIAYHFTFIPKYRRRRLVGNIKTRLDGMIRFCAQINQFEILELNIQPDHIHLLLTAKPSYSPAKIMQLIKGGTSKKLKEIFPNLDESIWTNGFWSDGYFIGTIGHRDMSDVIKYIKNQ